LKGTSSPLKAVTLQTNPNALHSDDVAVVHVASRSVTCTHVRGRNLLCASIGAGCVLPRAVSLTHSLQLQLRQLLLVRSHRHVSSQVHPPRRVARTKQGVRAASAHPRDTIPHLARRSRCQPDQHAHRATREDIPKRVPDRAQTTHTHTHTRPLSPLASPFLFMNVGNGVCAATHLMYPAKSFISSSVGLNTGIRPGMAPYVAIVPSGPLHSFLNRQLDFVLGDLALADDESE